MLDAFPFEVTFMGENHKHEPSDLFLVRLWLDQGHGGDSVGYGKVQHVITGESSAFADWSSLVDCLASLASAPSKRSLPSQPPAPVELSDSPASCDASEDQTKES